MTVLFLADVLTVLVLSSWLHTSSSSLSYLLFTLPPGLFNLHLPRWPLLMCLFHVFLVPCFFRYISNYTAENTHTHTHTPTRHLPTGGESRSLGIFLFSSTHSRSVQCQLSHYLRWQLCQQLSTGWLTGWHAARLVFIFVVSLNTFLSCIKCLMAVAAG